MGIRTGQFDEKIALFLSVESFFGAAGREKVAVWPLAFDNSVMLRRQERLLLAVREKALLGQSQIFSPRPVEIAMRPRRWIVLQ